MHLQITRCEELCGKDENYPLVLNVVVGDVETDHMSFSFRYRLKIEGDELHKKVTAMASSTGMRSRDCLDDEDADDYTAEALAGSIDEMKTYLKDMLGGAEITGTIHIAYNAIYHKPYDYDIYCSPRK